MFDSVLTGGNVARSRIGTGAIISIVVHGALIAAVLYLSAHPPGEQKEETEVKFFAAPPPAPPPPPPPPPPASHKTEHHEKKVIKKPDQIVQPKEIPQEKPPEAEPQKEEESEPEDNGVEGGVEGGVVGGVVGGTVGGVVGGQLGGEVLSFGEGMTRPVADPSNASHWPQYTREALEAHVEGMMLVQCVITVEGDLKDCKIIKPLPFMEKSVLDALSHWKFTPVSFQGHTISVKYVIPVRLVLPK